MEHRVIKPNIFYATFSQFVILVTYFFIAFICYRIMVFFIGFEIMPYIIESLMILDSSFLDVVINFIIDLVRSLIILIALPFILFAVNIINNKIEIENDRIIVKKGFINIHNETFLFNEIVRYQIDKDLGFLNTGPLEIFTLYGDKIIIEYVVNLKRAAKFMDKIVKKNKKELISRQLLNKDLTK